MEDLGLSAVRTTNVSRLTHSEKQRLSVACQLLTQASILILDQATTNMDIFDTFFLVEYLRQWCNSGRIVIMTLQPPTFEILSMCSGVLLLSGGRTVFSGSRSDLPRHMGSLGYPCPPFKNPADYYRTYISGKLFSNWYRMKLYFYFILIQLTLLRWMIYLQRQCLNHQPA